MPRASDHLRAEWWHLEDATGTERAMTFLQDAGYQITSEWCWARPTLDHEPTEQERRAIAYLTDEWDFGAIDWTLAAIHQ